MAGNYQLLRGLCFGLVISAGSLPLIDCVFTWSSVMARVLWFIAKASVSVGKLFKSLLWKSQLAQFTLLHTSSSYVIARLQAYPARLQRRHCTVFLSKGHDSSCALQWVLVDNISST